MALQNRFLRMLLNPWTVLLVLAAIVAVGVVYTLAQDEPDEANDQPGTVPVVLEPVRLASLEERVLGVGTLRASETVHVRPEVAGRIESIGFEEGGTVEQGEVLFTIDDRQLTRRLAAAEAAQRAAEVRAANAQRTFERQERLYERDVASPDEFDAAREQLDSALAEVERLEAEVEVIEQQLEDTRIRAAIDGRASQREVDRGTFVAVGDPLVSLYKSDPVEIGFSVPERYVPQVYAGQSVEVSVAAYPDRTFEGMLHFVSPAIDEATRTFRVRARVANPDHALRPGAFASAAIIVNVREDRPVIPSEALVATRDGYIVYVVEDDVAHRRTVRTGLRQDGMVEIVEGVEVGEPIIRTGHLRVSDGQRVTIEHGDESERP